MTQESYLIFPEAPLPKLGAEEVGNKAWNLMSMTAAGLPVPPGFVLPVSWCQKIRRHDLAGNLADGATLQASLVSGIRRIEGASGLIFGSPRRPLLVSVRSGGAISMPGMLETVLNIGMNSKVVDGLIRLIGNPRLAWDSYRRLVQGYAEVVCQLPVQPFAQMVETAVAGAAIEHERELDHRTLREIVRDMMRLFEELAGFPFPQDPYAQLRAATEAVFRSWDAPKAQTYRKSNGIDDGGGTAATVQMMVFGNAGGASGAGVGFTRDPATGNPEIYLDFLFNGQGEDVVAGRQAADDSERLRVTLPQTWGELQAIAHTLESLFRDAQDFEFTLQSGKLFLLQTRAAKRTPWAALRIAVDLVDEGLIEPPEALSRLSALDFGSVVRKRVARSDAGPPLARATVASIGVASGAIALDSEAAERMHQSGIPAILVRRDALTADIKGMGKAEGILTARGARTSHAAVVARQLGKVCLVACQDLEIDLARRLSRIGARSLNEGDRISLDGNDGAVYAGTLGVLIERPERELEKIAYWQTSQPHH